MSESHPSTSRAIALAAGLLPLAISTLFGLVQGGSRLLEQGYLTQGMPLLAARTLLAPALALAPAAALLGLALAAIHQTGAARARGVGATPAAAALIGVALAGCLWGLLRLLVPLVLGKAGDPELGDPVLLAVSAAAVWLLTRPAAAGSLAARVGARASKAAAAVLCAALLVWAAAGVADWIRRPAGPNVILVVVDTLRYDHLGFAGYDRPTTPALDALARESVRFERSYSTAPWTSPSVAALLTSRYPAELGYGDSATPARLGAREVLLPEILRDRGYRTDAIVSHTYVAEPLGFDQGFDTFDSENALGHHHVSSPSLLAKALARLDARPARPFFLFLHFFDPHFAYVQQRGFDFDPFYTGPIVSDLDYSRLLAAAPEMTPDDIRHVRALYDSEIAYTDRHVGLLLAGLEERGLAGETLVVVTADHGEAFLDRDDGWIGHGITLYDELIRVPLLIRPPGGLKRGGRSVTEPVSLVDVAPTVLAAAGVEPPQAWDPLGRALPVGPSSSAEAPARARERPVFAETRARGRWLQAVLWPGWKLVRDRRNDTLELFELDADPGEASDAAERRPETRDRLALLLEQWSRRQEEARRARPVDEATFTDQQLERLQALGYIE